MSEGCNVEDALYPWLADYLDQYTCLVWQDEDTSLEQAHSRALAHLTAVVEDWSPASPEEARSLALDYMEQQTSELINTGKDD